MRRVRHQQLLDPVVVLPLLERLQSGPAPGSVRALDPLLRLYPRRLRQDLVGGVAARVLDDLGLDDRRLGPRLREREAWASRPSGTGSRPTPPRPRGAPGSSANDSRRIYEGRVDTAKTERSERVLPIPSELLARLRNLSQDGWIFQARNGAPLDPKNAIVRHVKPAAKEAGIESLNWHSFRHSFAVNQRREGTHPKVLSAMLGHSRVQLAMDVYDHVNVEELRAPLEKLLRDRTGAERRADSKQPGGPSRI